jgi:hypothetical protein
MNRGALLLKRLARIRVERAGKRLRLQPSLTGDAGWIEYAQTRILSPFASRQIVDRPSAPDELGGRSEAHPPSDRGTGRRAFPNGATIGEPGFAASVPELVKCRVATLLALTGRPYTAQTSQPDERSGLIWSARRSSTPDISY